MRHFVYESEGRPDISLRCHSHLQELELFPHIAGIGRRPRREHELLLETLDRAATGHNITVMIIGAVSR